MSSAVAEEESTELVSLLRLHFVCAEHVPTDRESNKARALKGTPTVPHFSLSHTHTHLWPSCYLLHLQLLCPQYIIVSPTPPPPSSRVPIIIFSLMPAHTHTPTESPTHFPFLPSLAFSRVTSLSPLSRLSLSSHSLLLLYHSFCQP